MCRPRLSCEIKGESRSSKARSLASRKFVSKTGWLACCCCCCCCRLYVRVCVCGYYECVDVEPVAPRCCCCCYCGRLMERCSVPLEARCEQTRTKYARQKRPRFSVRSHVCMSAYILSMIISSSQQMIIRSATASDPTELRFHSHIRLLSSCRSSSKCNWQLVTATGTCKGLAVLRQRSFVRQGNINGDEAMRR